MMNLKQNLILGSKSPRRRQILQDAGFTFKTVSLEVEEIYPSEMQPEMVPVFLAKKKASAYIHKDRSEILITSDTIVVLNNTILEKPKDRSDASKMLKSLSGNTHKVITGVCLTSMDKSVAFDDTTLVTFNPLSDQEIDYYLDIWKPYDKAGSYGVQEFIGMIGIPKIEGSFYTVMGLPIHLVYSNLNDF